MISNHKNQLATRFNPVLSEVEHFRLSEYFESRHSLYMTSMAIIKEGPPVGGHLGSAKYREGRQIMGILCKGGHISAAVYKQRSTWHVSQLIGRKRRQENFTIQRHCHLVSAFVLCSPKCLSFIFSFPDQWVGLPTLAHFNKFPNCNLETWEGYFACCERSQQAGTDMEVRTDEILIWAYMGRKEEQMERWRSLASKEDPAISIHGMVWGSLDGESD